MRAWTAIGGFAAALGPLVGGLLVTVSWRWIFTINVPIGLIASLAGWQILPRVPGHEAPRPNLWAAFLITGEIAALTFTIVKVNDWGWTSPGIAASLVFALILIVLFVHHCLLSESVCRSDTLSCKALHRCGIIFCTLRCGLRRHAAIDCSLAANGVGVVSAENWPRHRARSVARAGYIASLRQETD